MCNNFPNIRITEGNNFSIILPLLSRTYVATRPIDEEIDPEQLENVVVSFGGVQYPAQRTTRGVQIDLPATLAVGTYNILLTAEYLGSNIRAAYESAVTIVPWSEQSTAEQYITGSPIVLRAAYVLSGALTDAELEALKEEYREKNAQLAQAIADAEAEKREWEEKAADLDGVAKQGTNPEATNTAILEAVQQGGGTDIAKESTSQQILGRVQVLPTMQEIMAAGLIPLSYDGIEMAAGVTVESAFDLINKRGSIVKITDPTISTIPAGVNASYTGLLEIDAPNAYELQQAYRSANTIQIARHHNAVNPNLYLFANTTQSMRVIDLYSALHNISVYNPFANANNIIDIITGANFEGNCSWLASWSPANALLPNSTSLVNPGETFSSNLEKLLYNIREHIAANLPVAPNTINFSAAVKAAILADQPTADAFTNKNWTIA